MHQGQLSLQLFQRCLQVGPLSWKSLTVCVSLDASLSTRSWGLVGSTWALPAMSWLRIHCEYGGPRFWTWTWTSKWSVSQLHGQSAYCLRQLLMGLYLKYDRCPNHPIGSVCWSILHSSPHQPLQKRFAGIAKPCNSRLVGPNNPCKWRTCHYCWGPLTPLGVWSCIFLFFLPGWSSWKKQRGHWCSTMVFPVHQPSPGSLEA